MRYSIGWILSLSVSAVTFADVLDSSLKDYLVERVDSGPEDLKSDKARLIEKKKEISVPVKKEVVEEKRRDLERERAKLSLLRDLRAKTLGKIDSKVEVQTLVLSAFDNPQSQQKIADLWTASEKIKKGETIETQPVVSRLPIDDTSPVDVVAQVALDAKGDPKLSFRFESNPSRNSKFSNETNRKLTAAEIDSVIEKELNPILAEKPVEVLPGKEVKDSLKEAAGKSSDRTLLGTKESALYAGLDQLEADKDPTKSNSSAAKLNSEIKELTDNTDRQERLNELNAKIKVADWLAQNSPNGKSPCEVLIAAVGLKDLPKRMQQECGPSKTAKEKSDADTESDSKKETAQKPAPESIVAKAQQDFEAEFTGIVNNCLSIYRNAAASSQTKGIVDTVKPIFDRLMLQGMTSPMIGELLTSDPMMMAIGGMDMDPTELIDAASEIARSKPDTREAFNELERERKTAGKVLAIAGNLLSSLADASANGLADPAILQSPDVQKLIKYRTAAIAVMEATSREIDSRRARNMSRLRGIGSSGVRGGGGVPVVGNGSRATSNSPGRVRPADQRYLPQGAAGDRPASRARPADKLN
jgi:hypothetical protein